MGAARPAARIAARGLFSFNNFCAKRKVGSLWRVGKVPKPKFGGRPALDSRTVFNAILWELEQHLS